MFEDKTLRSRRNTIAVPEPSPNVDSLVRAVSAIREQIQIMVGDRGDDLDRAVSLRDLVHYRLLDANKNASWDTTSLRNNQALTDAGTFTPVLSFTNAGDLSNAYTQQVGEYWRSGGLLFFNARVVTTPTFSTSTGDLEITGCPFISDTQSFLYFPARVFGVGFTYPAGVTDIIGVVSPGTSLMRVIGQGSAIVGDTIDYTAITSGVSLTVSFNGVYPIDGASL